MTVYKTRKDEFLPVLPTNESPEEQTRFNRDVLAVLEDVFRKVRTDIDTVDDNNTEVQNDIEAILRHKTLISGFEISNDTDTEHDINVAAGSAVDSTSTTVITLPSGMTKQLDAPWAEGDDAGGLDTGSIANSTWYYPFGIKKDSDGSADLIFSASKPSPTMPQGYTYFRRVRGAVLTDGSANIIQFNQKDNRFIFDARIEDYTGTPGTSRAVLTVSVPPSMLGLFIVHRNDNNTAYSWFEPTSFSDVVPDVSNSDLRTEDNNRAPTITREVLVDDSSQVAYRLGGSPSVFKVATYGFEDFAQS